MYKLKPGIVPKKFQEKTNEKLSAVNNSKLNVNSKTEASILNNEVFIKTTFILVNDIRHTVILGTLFIGLITPYKVNNNYISFKFNYKKLEFEFLEKPRTRNLNLINVYSIYENSINVLIQEKKIHLENLKKIFPKKNNKTIRNTRISK